jgi:hypothetical protein
MVVTYMIVCFMSIFVPLLKTHEQQESARDEQMHGEAAYELEDLLATQLGIKHDFEEFAEDSDDNVYSITPGRGRDMRTVKMERTPRSDGSPRETPRPHGLLC